MGDHVWDLVYDIVLHPDGTTTGDVTCTPRPFVLTCGTWFQEGPGCGWIRLTWWQAWRLKLKEGARLVRVERER